MWAVPSAGTMLPSFSHFSLSTVLMPPNSAFSLSIPSIFLVQRSQCALKNNGRGWYCLSSVYLCHVLSLLRWWTGTESTVVLPYNIRKKWPSLGYVETADAYSISVTGITNVCSSIFILNMAKSQLLFCDIAPRKHVNQTRSNTYIKSPEIFHPVLKTSFGCHTFLASSNVSWWVLVIWKVLDINQHSFLEQPVTKIVLEESKIKLSLSVCDALLDFPQTTKINHSMIFREKSSNF